MSDHQILNQVLPDEFATTLRGLYRRRGRPEPELAAVILAASARGWTYTAIGNALGVTHERVRQLAATAPKHLRLSVDVPEPPVKVKPVKAGPPMLTAEQAQQLRNLREQADARRAHHHPGYLASIQLAELVHRYRLAGYRMVDLTRAAGASKTELHFLLGRHGYRDLPPSMRPKYAHIRGPIGGVSS